MPYAAIDAAAAITLPLLLILSFYAISISYAAADLPCHAYSIFRHAAATPRRYATPRRRCLLFSPLLSPATLSSLRFSRCHYGFRHAYHY
jgi:hypothetical protein